MSDENVSVREDVYDALKREKADEESFSDVVERLLERRDGDHPLYDLVGTLDADGVERIREGSEEFRECLDRDPERSS